MTVPALLFTLTLSLALFSALTRVGRTTIDGGVRDLCGLAGAVLVVVGALAAIGLMQQAVLAGLCLVIGGCE